MGLKVTNILKADTFEVFPPWHWKGQSGIKVKVADYDVPLEGKLGYDTAKKRLESIITDKEVELRNETKVDYDCLVCDVYVDGENVKNK